MTVRFSGARAAHARRVLEHIEHERAKALALSPAEQEEFAANMDADEARQKAKAAAVWALCGYARRARF